MILSNVNIGSAPSAGDGDRLRTAFSTINQNFARIQSNVNAITNSVSSVAGRTGNVVLTTQDIVGINNYSTITYVDSKLSANVANLQANITLIQADINTLYGNAGVQSATLATLTANAASQAGSLTTLTANAASQAGELTTLLSNAAVQAGEIASLLSNAGSQHEAISSLQSNAAVQAGLIAALQANVGVSNYGNSNVAVYLTTYAGNVKAGNIIFDDLSVQTTAYTGTQWRSNLESNVRVKPSWLSYVPGGKNQEGTQYGFDTGGMFFTSNADNDFAYPIQTNLHFHEQDVLEVIATIYYGATNNDHGLCIFPADERPIWQSSSNTTRIAFQYSAGIPVLYGQTTANTAPGSPVLSSGNYYTIKFKYDPGNTVVVETFSGNTTTGSPVDTRSLAEVLPAGDYRLGFDADNDAAGVKSYWTNLVVRTLTNTVVNDLEVQGQVIGNLIPQSNVAQSLGNITHQWKDLWVSNSTVYINSIPLSIDNGGNLLINGNTVAGSSYANVAVKTYLENYDGSIVQIPDEHLYIRVQDADDDDFSIYQQVDDGASNVLGQTRLRRDQYVIDFPVEGFQFRFTDIGQAELPGNIRFNEYVDSSIYAVSDDSYNGSAELKVINYSGDTLGSNVRVTQNYASISTNNAQYSWIFSNIGIVTVPGTINFANSQAISPIGETAIKIRGSSDDSGAMFDAAGEAEIYANTNVYIYSDQTSSQKTWNFAQSGTLSTAGDIIVNGDVTGRVGTATLGLRAQPGSDTYIQLNNAVDSTVSIAADLDIVTDSSNTAYTWTFGIDGNLTFPDTTVQTTAWTGEVLYGNTISIGYLTGESSQGNNAVAIGSTAGQTSQGAKAIGIGEVAGRLNQGIESIGLGAGAGEQNQGAYAIAIGSTTAYLNQGVGAVAIGTSAGALYQGEHAIAIGTGAGNGLQGNNSIILNATGSTLDQNTDDTFTVKPIRGASAGNILYYDPSSGEITYSTFSVTYGNTIALGYSAGVNQGEYSVAIGSEAGATTQGNLAVAVGRKAGSSIQGDGAVAVGESAGWAQQGEGAVAVGREAALADQSAYAVAIGYNAGADTQGAYSIAIGQGAGTAFQPANSIIINSSADSLNTSTAGLYINPIRNTTGNVGVLQYNNATKEVSYNTNVTLGNVSAGNLVMTNNVSGITFPVGSYIQGNTSISNRGGSIVLQPNTAASSFAGVIIGGAGRILSPSGFVNIINGDSAVTLQAPTTVSSATASTNSTTGALVVTGGVGIGGNLNIGSGNLAVTNNTTTGNLSTAGSILSSGVNGKIGYSAGGYVVQSGNTSGITLNTISGNIQLDTVNIAVNTTHTVALTNNKLDANDIILVQGQDTNAIDLHIGAYYITTNTAVIYLRNISGSSIGPIAPMLKFIIVKAPGS